MAKTPNFFKAAFLLPANLMALLTAAASSAMTENPLPAAVALGVEALYLTVVPLLGPFRRSVQGTQSGKDAEVARQEVEALLSDLSPSQREHYQQLVGLREKILANYAKLPGGRVLVVSSEAQLDGLLTSFLRLVGALNQYRAFMSSAERQPLEKELLALQVEVDQEQNARLKEVKAKRVELLRRRLARFDQARETREVVSHQIASIEDLMRLTHEQSITIRDPETVNRQLEALGAEAQATDDSVREMERFLEFEEEARGPLPHGTRVR